MQFHVLATAIVGFVFQSNAPASESKDCTVAALPLRFVPNHGQFAEGAEFVARAPGYEVRASGDGLGFVLASGASPATVQMVLAGATKTTGTPADPLPGVSHWFRGERSITDVPGYGRVRYAGVRPGVDLELHGAGVQFEFDLRVAPHAPRGDLALQFAGAEAIARERDGSLRLDTSAGALRFHRPHAWQEIDGARVVVDADYAVQPSGRVDFVLGAHREELPLVIDPVVQVATYLGGTGFDAVYDVAVTSTGEVVVTGQTSSTDFPIVNALQPSITPFHDVFVAKFDATLSSLVWSTYLGGTAAYDKKEAGISLVLDANDNVFVLGETTAADFPVLNAFQPTRGGAIDSVLFGLSSTGGALLFSTYLGGAKDDLPAELAIDAAGSLFAIGSTRSTDFPVVSALQSSLDGLSDAYVASFDVGGGARFSTYFGGPEYDEGKAIAIDTTGGLLVAGSAESGFPITPGAFADHGPGFISRIDNAGSTLVASTMFGGAPTAIGRDASDRIYVAGSTGAFDFPTTFGAWQTEHGGSYDGHGLQIFAAALTYDLQSQIYGTYYGSFSRNETVADIVVDDVGEMVIFGESSEHTGTNTEYALLLKLSPDGSAVAWTQGIGTWEESGFGVVRDAAGVLHLGGQSWGTLGPTAGAFQQTYQGSSDGFVAQVVANAATIAHLTLRSTRVIGGDALEGTVTLDGDAPAGGAVVALSSSSPTIASVPPTVLVPAGHSTATFLVTTTPVGASTPVTITATWNGAATRDLLVWLGPSWRIDFLGTLVGAESSALGIADSGRIAGRSRGSDIYFHVTRFTDGVVEDLGQGEGSDINESSQVSASFGTALRYTDGIGLVDLGTLSGGSMSEARGINDAGQVVGWSDGGGIQQHAFRFTDGVGMEDLGTLGGDLSDAEDVNDSGQVTGSSFLGGNTKWRAFRFTDGVGMKNLGILSGFAHAYGHAINDSGQVAGTVFDSSYATPHAFRFTDGAGMLDLGTLPGETSSRGEAIDAAGRVAGNSGERVFLWTDVIGMEDVTDGLAPENLFGWDLLDVNGMNDRGVIVGTAYFLGNHRQESAFRIVPTRARWNTYGAGWPGTNGIPPLLPSDVPRLGQSLTVTLYNSLGSQTPGLLFLGFDDVSIPTRGGTLLVAPFVLIPLLVPAGGLALTDTLPSDPAYGGVSVFLQGLELDAGAVAGLSFSPGLELVLGN